MTNPADIEQLARGLNALQKQLAQAQANATDETMRQQLGALAPQLKSAGAQFLADYPAAMADAQKKLDDAGKQAKAMQEELDRLQKQAEEAEEAQRAAATARPRPVGEAIDPQLGRRLRLELLHRFGNMPMDVKALDPELVLDPEFVADLKRKGLWS